MKGVGGDAQYFFKITRVLRRLLDHRKLPLGLALAAILLMLPALPVGLGVSPIPWEATLEP